MKKALINCDDLGMHPAINDGIILILKRGYISSCSILPTGIYFQDALIKLKSIPFHEVGVHLTLCSEYPSHAPLKSVLNPELTLPLLEEWREKNKNLDFIKKELSAQIEKVKLVGLKITHLDGHMFFYEPSIGGHEVLQICVDLAKKWKVPLRIKEKTTDHEFPQKIEMIWEEYDTINSRTSYYTHFFNKIMDNDFYELIIHPGLSIEQMKIFTSQPTRRYADYLFFTSAYFENEICKNIKVLGYKDLM